MPWGLLTKSMAKSVDIATRIPRLFRTYALSSEASAELVPQTGHLSTSEGYLRIMPFDTTYRDTRLLRQNQRYRDPQSSSRTSYSFSVSQPPSGIVEEVSPPEFLHSLLTYPRLSFPWAAVAIMIPKMRKNVANTIPVRRPSLSMMKPKASMPKISPMR